MRTDEELEERWPSFVDAMEGHHFTCLVGHELSSLHRQSRAQLVAFLSAMEGESRLPTHLWERIVRFKALLGGRAPEPV